MLDLTTLLPVASGSLSMGGRAAITSPIPPASGPPLTIFVQGLVGSTLPHLTNLEILAFSNL